MQEKRKWVPGYGWTVAGCGVEHQELMGAALSSSLGVKAPGQNWGDIHRLVGGAVCGPMG